MELRKLTIDSLRHLAGSMCRRWWRTQLLSWGWWTPAAWSRIRSRFCMPKTMWRWNTCKERRLRHSVANVYITQRIITSLRQNIQTIHVIKQSVHVDNTFNLWPINFFISGATMVMVYECDSTGGWKSMGYCQNSWKIVACRLNLRLK